MTQPSVGPEQRKVDALNAAMRGGYTAPEFDKTDNIDEILRKHLNVTGENIRLREELATARKARDAAQELLEAERNKSAKFEAGMSGVVFTAINSATSGMRKELDTERLLRVNDASTIADLERRLREAEGQLKAQRDRIAAHDSNIEWYSERRTELAAENAELRRTLGMVGKYLDELKELVSDPANPKGKP